jgi:alpha-ribazole phosphatase
MTIFLLRHTTPDVAKGVCYGQTDVPVASTFVGEAADAASRLRFCDCDVERAVVVSSPLQRCTRLAESLCAPISNAYTTDDRLKEMHFGDWEMQPWSAIEESALTAWMNDFVNVAAPAGESFQMLYDRSIAAMEEHEAQFGGETGGLVVIAHAGIIRAILAHALELPLRKAFSLELGYGSISAIRRRNRRSEVLFVNR